MTGNSVPDLTDAPNPALIGFRRMVLDDLPALHRWLQTAHVLEWWWGGVAPSYAAVVEKYAPRIRREEPTDPYVMLYGDRPIGFIQTYMIRDYPEYAHVVAVDDGAAGVDLFIGEADVLHRGLGSRILRAFVRAFIFGASNATCCVIGPSETNRIAIRAYEKAGFRYVKTVPSPNEPTPEYLMFLTRAGSLGEEGSNCARSPQLT